MAAFREARGVVGGWNGAAAKLGISRTNLIYKMQRLGLSKQSREHFDRGGRADAQYFER
jgi:hypothetical protein